MWKRKQILSTLLVAAMVSSMLAGCGQTGEKPVEKSESQSSAVGSAESKQPESSAEESKAEEPESTRISEETITLTVAGVSLTDWNETIQFQEYEKRLGIKLDATVYGQEQWDSKLTLMLAADEMPDLIANAGMTLQGVIEYGGEGYFLDFSEYLDIMPNLSRILEEYPDYASSIICPDGGIYAFPSLNLTCGSNRIQSVYLNKKWMDNLGLKEPETLDELYDVLLAFKEKDADGDGDTEDEVAFGWTPQWFTCESPILWAHGIYGNYVVYNLMANESGEVVLGDTTDNYKDFLKYMKKLYDAGIMTEDAFVIGVEDRRAQWNDLHVGMLGTSGNVPGAVEDRAQWIAVPGYTSEYVSDRVIVENSQIGTKYILAANSATEYPEEIAKFVDYLFSEEGAISASNGYEGVSFDYIDFFGTDSIDHKNYAFKSGYDESNWGMYRQEKVVAVNGFNVCLVGKGSAVSVYDKYPGDALTADPEFYQALLEQIGTGVLREVAYRNADEVISVYPTVYYTEDETTERETILADVHNYLRSAKAQFITGELDIDKDWNAHLDTLKKMGLDRLLEIEQTAYTRFISK